MSVAFRSWAASTLFSFSGWDEREGGERRRLRSGEGPPAFFVWTGAKSKVLSMVTAGAIAFGVTRQIVIFFSLRRSVVGREVDKVCFFPRVAKELCQTLVIVTGKHESHLTNRQCERPVSKAAGANEKYNSFLVKKTSSHRVAE